MQTLYRAKTSLLEAKPTGFPLGTHCMIRTEYHGVWGQWASGPDARSSKGSLRRPKPHMACDNMNCEAECQQSFSPCIDPRPPCHRKQQAHAQHP
jgi:hypothetical protein